MFTHQWQCCFAVKIQAKIEQFLEYKQKQEIDIQNKKWKIVIYYFSKESSN